MGGRRLGAGRPGWRRKCDDFLALDLRQLRARRVLLVGAAFRWQWARAGDEVGAVQISVDRRGVTLCYSVEKRGIEQRIDFAWTPTWFGGKRMWIACPACRRRCVVLYGVDNRNRFSCRLCMDLAYPCEAESVTQRLWRKQAKLEALIEPDGRRPKRMHRRTYEGVCDRIDAVEDTRLAAFLDRTRSAQ